MRIKAFILCFCSLLWLCSGCFAEENIETNNSPVKMTPSAKDNREMSTASPASEAPSSAPESPTSLTPTTEPAVTDSHPFSPLPSELPHESPMPGDYDYIPPVSGMDFSAPGIYEIAENTTYSVDFDNDGVFVTLTIRNTTYTSSN